MQLQHRTGICCGSYIALREQPSHRAEQVTQLLFGEMYHILHTHKDWSRVRCLHDQYEAWLPNGQLYLLSSDAPPLAAPAAVLTQEGVVTTQQKHSLRLSVGSLLPCFDGYKQRFLYQQQWLSMPQTITPPAFALPTANAVWSSVLRLMMAFVGTPYLWGGRTLWGIDCSGLVQIAARLAGMWLPRDASQQATYPHASVVPQLSDAQAGDLVFFSSQPTTDNITHTGILLSNNSVLHASHWVQTDHIDPIGIYKIAAGQPTDYTHYLRHILRLDTAATASY